MVVIFDEETQQRFSVDKFSGDFMYLKDNASQAVIDETVPVIGPWQDHTGSKKVNSRALQLNPTPNKFQGEIPEIKGEDMPNLNEVGESTNFKRRRQRKVIVDLDKVNKSSI